MTKAEKAKELFASGLNCAQAVLVPFSDRHGIGEKQALLISCGFGGGVGRSDNLCGAVSGAVMALGLKYGAEKASEKEKKELCYSKVGEFISSFRNKYGEVSCTGLLGCNMSTPEGMAEAKAKEVHTKVCPKFVEFAANYLEGLEGK